jgi:hypothetical protein
MLLSRGCLGVLLVTILAAPAVAAPQAGDPATVTAQAAPASARLRVYLDCFDCFSE